MNSLQTQGLLEIILVIELLIPISILKNQGFKNSVLSFNPIKHQMTSTVMHCHLLDLIKIKF